MPFIEWKDGLSTGFEPIDKQHRRLIELINSFMAAHAKGMDQQTLSPLLGELRDYTKRHFADEEDLMRKMRFPALSEHQTLHMHLATRVRQYQDMLYRHRPVDIREFGNFLKDWLIQHILYKDMEYVKFKRQKDAAAAQESARIQAEAEAGKGS